ncbi:endonuclease/exonuclease/phosphatase family protein [Phycisphaeraceae bacterium D3-23]
MWKVRAAFILPLFTMLVACGTTPDADAPRRLRVLTYNIHHAQGTDGEFDYKRLADIIRSVEPDVVALQEVDVATGRSSGVDQPAVLGEHTGMYPYFVSAKPYDGGLYGEAILTRVPIEGVPAGLDTAGIEPDLAMLAIAVVGLHPWGDEGPTVTFAGAHLSPYAAEARLSQVGQINDQLLVDPNRLVLIAGDFNFTPGAPGHNAMTARWLDTADHFGDPQPTFPSNPSIKRIDYVFAYPVDRWRVLEVRVLDEPLASDHAPVLVVLEVVE